MTFILESPYMQFTLNPEKSSWSLNSALADGPSLDDVWMRVNYRGGLKAFTRTRKRRFQFLEKWYKPRISAIQEVTTHQGLLKQVQVEMGPDVNGIRYQLEFCISMQHPLFLWRLTLENDGNHTIEVDNIEMLRAGFFPKRQILPNPGPLSFIYKPKPVGYGSVRPNPDLGELGFFSNGWQSWSFSGAYGSENIYQASQLGFFAAQLWYPGGKAPRRMPGAFSSDMFGVIGDRQHRSAILVGFLSQQQHFGSLDAHIADPLYPALNLYADGDRARLDPGAQISTDWAVIQFVEIDAPDPLLPYLDAVAREHEIPDAILQTSSPVGWCSWYQYFSDIDEDTIRANLESAEALRPSIPMELFQIDDGFESKIGDWFESSPGFPSGPAPLAAEIKEKGFRPGLWLAPFILHSGAKSARKRRDWLLRNRFGLPVNAGFLWNSFTKALDLTHPEVMEYVRDVVRTAVQEWGYTYLKLDFLYAAALKGRYHDRTKTRAQVLRRGLEAIRDAVGPEVMLLGCGVPLGPSIGIFDIMRIGADVDPSWEPHLFPPQILFRLEPNMPSTRNALQNILSRAFTHKRWWLNDPDCLMIRPGTDLTLAEVQTLATAIAITGGPLLLSDDLTELLDDRLRIAQQLIPLIDKPPRVLDWFDSPTPGLLRLDLGNATGKWHLLGIFNWTDELQDCSFSLAQLDLPDDAYFAREFWSGNLQRVSDGILHLSGIPAHGAHVVALTPEPLVNPAAGGDQPLYLGGDLHISQGLEVAEWSLSQQGVLRIGLERPGTAKGVIDLYLPLPPESASINGEKLSWQQVGDQCYRFPIKLDQRTVIEVKGCIPA